MTGLFIDDAVSHSLSEVSHGLSCNRRDFLRDTTDMVLGGALSRAGPFLHAGWVKKRKVIVVTFSGGARDQRYTYILQERAMNGISTKFVLIDTQDEILIGVSPASLQDEADLSDYV